MRLCFHEKLSRAINAIESHLCVGIDPEPTRLSCLENPSLQSLERQFECLSYAVFAIIDATENAAPIVKFQSAFFEAFGAGGIAVLEGACAYARKKNLLVILDAKRGDIASTMQAYGRSAFEVFQADALTVLPYMGVDALTALTQWIQQGYGIYVVGISSNPSGTEIQNLELAVQGNKEPLWQNVMRQFEESWQRIMRDSEGVSGLHSLGWVVGATKQDMFPQLQRILPKTDSILIPGVGAQGGAVDENLRRQLRTFPTSIVSVSRGLLPDERAICESGSDFATRRKFFESSIREKIHKYSRELAKSLDS